jgi:hypothetical protein
LQYSAAAIVYPEGKVPCRYTVLVVDSRLVGLVYNQVPFLLYVIRQTQIIRRNHHSFSQQQTANIGGFHGCAACAVCVPFGWLATVCQVLVARKQMEKPVIRQIFNLRRNGSCQPVVVEIELLDAAQLSKLRRNMACQRVEDERKICFRFTIRRF